MKNKFNIKDKVWTMHKNQVREALVTGIILENGGTYRYTLDYISTAFAEDGLFASQEELFEVLKQNPVNVKKEQANDNANG